MSFKLPCPACKKPVINGATKCPHCLTVYSPEQLAERKSNAKAGFIGMAAIVLGIVLSVYACSGKDEPAPAPQESQSAAALELTDKQSSVLTFVRGVRLQTLSCSGDVDMAQAAIDKMAGGRVAPIEAYEGLRKAEKACRSALADLDGFNPAQFDVPQAAALGRDALASCRKGVDQRRAAMAQGKAYLDGGDSSLEIAAQFRDKLRSAQSSDATCKLQLAAFASSLGVPDSALDFLN